MPSKNEWWHLTDPESIAKQEAAKAKMREAAMLRKKMKNDRKFCRRVKEAHRSISDNLDVERAVKDQLKAQRIADQYNLDRAAGEVVKADAIMARASIKKRRINDARLDMAREQIQELRRLANTEDPWDAAMMAGNELADLVQAAEQRLSENPNIQRKRIKDLIMAACTPDDQRLMVAAMIKKAKGGDVFAFNALYDRLIGKPNQKVEMEIETTKIDQYIQLIIADPEASRFADDLARRLAHKSCGPGERAEQGAVGVGGPPGFVECEVKGSGDGKDQAVDGLDASASWQKFADLSVLPGLVSGDVQEPPDHSGELRSELRGELGPESPKPDIGESGQTFNKAG